MFLNRCYFENTIYHLVFNIGDILAVSALKDFQSLRTCLKQIFSVEKDGFSDLKQPVFSLIAALWVKKPTKSNRKRRFFGLNNSF